MQGPNKPPQPGKGEGRPAMSDLYISMVNDQRRMRQTQARRRESYQRRNQAPPAENVEEEKDLDTEEEVKEEPRNLLGKRSGRFMEDDEEDSEVIVEKKYVMKRDGSSKIERGKKFDPDKEPKLTKEPSVKPPPVVRVDENLITMTKRMFFSLYASRMQIHDKWFRVPKSELGRHKLFERVRNIEVMNGDQHPEFMTDGNVQLFRSTGDMTEHYISLLCSNHPESAVMTSFLQDNQFTEYLYRTLLVTSGHTAVNMILDYEIREPETANRYALDIIDEQAALYGFGYSITQPIFGLDPDQILEELHVEILEVADNTKIRGFSFMGRFEWVPNASMIELSDYFTVVSTQAETVTVRVNNITRYFEPMMRAKRLATLNMDQQMTRETLMEMLSHVVVQLIRRHSWTEYKRLMHYGMIIPVAEESFESWKIAASLLSEIKELTLPMLLSNETHKFIKGSFLDTTETPVILQANEYVDLEDDTVMRRRYMALLTVIMNRIGKNSIAARWYDTGRLSPLTLLVLFRDIQKILHFTIVSLPELLTDDIVTRAALTAKLTSIYARPEVQYYAGTVNGQLQMDAEFDRISNFDLVRGGDASIYVTGMIITKLCERLTVYHTMEIASKWWTVQRRLREEIRSKGFKRIQQTLASVEVPQNLSEINRGAFDKQLEFERISSYRWKEIFRDFISKTTEFVTPEVLREAYNSNEGPTNRKVGMKVISLSSEINSYRTSIDAIREAINRELISEFTRGSYGHTIEQVNRNIAHIRLFIGFEFNVYDTDIHGMTTMNHRSIGFEFVFYDFIQPGPQHRNFKFIPTRLALAEKTFGANEYQFIREEHINPDRARIGDFINGAVIERTHEMLHDELILDQMQESFTASGPGEEDYKQLFEEIHEETVTDFSRQMKIAREVNSDFIKNGAIDIYINQVTFITAPAFRNEMAPLITSRPPRNPVVGANDAYAESLLNESKYDLAAFKLRTAQLGLHSELVNKLTCAIAASWYIMVWACEFDEDYVNCAFIRMKENMKFEDKLNNIVFWLEVARVFINQVLKQQFPIFIFFTSSCRVIEFSMGTGMLKYIDVLMSEQRMAYDYPVVVISGEFTAMAHAYVTAAEKLYKYVDYRANTKLRRNLDKFNSHRGFSLIRGEMYKNIMDPPVPVSEILEDLMDNIWTLDIETYSAKGVKMEPYCIVIESKIQVELQAFGHPEDVRALFSDFMSNLKQRRGPKSESLTIYAHNGAKFDWVVLMKDLLELFPDMNVAGRLTEAKYISIPSINLKLADFFLMVSSSLADIAREFETKTQETSCEVIMGLDNVDKLSNNQKFQILEYCINDCQCLLECVEKFTLEMLEVSGAERLVKPSFVLPPTSSKVAQNIFAAKYLGLTKLHGNLSLRIDQMEKEAYYGGITQVFTLSPQEDIHYIDVNSLYPAAMVDLKVSTYPAEPEDIEDFQWRLIDDNCSVEELEDHFIYDVELFSFKADAFGMLPVRLEQGGLLYPRMNKCTIGDWRAGVELKALVRSGMLEELNIRRLLRYPDATTTLFKGYIQDIYKEKASCEDGAEKTVYKLLLNQLYGKFAERTFDERFVIRSEAFENSPQVIDKVCTRELNISCLSDMMTEKDPNNRSEVIKLYEETGKYYQKDDRIPQLACIHKIDDEGKWLELVITKDPSDMQSIGKLKRIAMMTTAKARSIMIDAMGLVYKELGDLCKHIYYMDTDSFFCSHEAYLVFEKHKLLSNSELGEFKDEVKAPWMITHAQFYASKVYHYERCNTNTGVKELKCEFKGMKKGLFKNPEDCIKIYRDMMKPGQIQELRQDKWSRAFGHIVIEEVLKETVAKPRRMVLPDGTTRSFEFVDEFETFTKDKRVVLHDDGTFNYEEYE